MGARGDASLAVSGERNPSIRLTEDEPAKKGSLWTKDALANLGDEWAVEVEYSVTGKGSEYFGDGFAFWITRQKPRAEGGGDVFGSQDRWHGLGVFFDTFDNGNRNRQTHPHVTAMMNDGTLSYTNGDIGTQGGIPSCHANFRRHEGDSGGKTWFRIHYHDSKRVDVWLRGGKEEDWSRCAEITGADLSGGAYFWVLRRDGRFYRPP